jgi:uncharacterized membrane protein
LIYAVWTTFLIVITLLVYLYVRLRNQPTVIDVASLTVAIASLFLAALSTHFGGPLVQCRRRVG